MPGTVDQHSLPFDEQIAYFRDKLKLTSNGWTDVFSSENNHAFTVAGATTADVVDSFHKAVLKFIDKGLSLVDFQRDFDAIVARTGWQYKGGRSWRTRVIYDTNLRQSYNAGREAQMADPELRKLRPYGRYVHNDKGISQNPRPEHLAWHNTVLPLDSPWWDTHTPSNGWECKCGKHMLSDQDVARLGLKVSDSPPPIVWRDVVVGKNSKNPRSVRVPEGIDPGFEHRPASYRTLQMLGKTATLHPRIAVDYFSAIKNEARPDIIQQGTRMINSMLADPRTQHRSATIWAMGKPELDYLQQHGIEPARIDITIDDKQVVGAKRMRHDDQGNALSDVEWAQLPLMIATRKVATLFDKETGEILYVLNPLGADNRLIKVVVKADYTYKKKSGPESVTVFKVNRQALMDKRLYFSIDGKVE